LLNKIKDEPISLEIMRTTKISRTVGLLRRIENDSVKNLASEIVEKWREIANASKEAKKENLASSETKTTENSDTLADNKSHAGTKRKEESIDSPEQKRAKQEISFTEIPSICSLDSDVENNKDKKKKCVDALLKKFGPAQPWYKYDPKELSEQLVNHMLNHFKSFSKDFTIQLQIILSHFKTPLIKRIMEDYTILKDFPTMKEVQFLPKEQRAEIEEKQAEHDKFFSPPEIGDVADGLYECPKCHKKKVDVRYLQTRSADEPMTKFCTCLNCRHQFKIY